MHIEWSIDLGGTLAGKIDPDDLFGDIVLRDGHGATIRDESVYLENWFDCFVMICERLPAEGIFQCDLVTEPDPLVFHFDGHGLSITYKSQKIQNVSPDAFCNAIAEAGQRLVSRLEKEAPDKERLSLLRLEAFLLERVRRMGCKIV